MCFFLLLLRKEKNYRTTVIPSVVACISILIPTQFRAPIGEFFVAKHTRSLAWSTLLNWLCRQKWFVRTHSRSNAVGAAMAGIFATDGRIPNILLIYRETSQMVIDKATFSMAKMKEEKYSEKIFGIWPNDKVEGKTRLALSWATVITHSVEDLRPAIRFDRESFTPFSEKRRKIVELCTHTSWPRSSHQFYYFMCARGFWFHVDLLLRHIWIVGWLGLCLCGCVCSKDWKWLGCVAKCVSVSTR